MRDRRELLAACLEALTRQTCGDFEVIVVDDGSTDGSGEVAARFAGRLRVTPVRTAGVGAVAARCRGIERARGEVLAFTDSDCVPEPSWIAAGLAAIDAGADVVQGRTVAARPPRPLDRTMTARSDDGLYPTCNVFYRRSAYDRAGGFDRRTAERLGFRPDPRARGLGFGEDTLLGWRVRRHGRAIASDDAVVLHHVFGPDPRDLVRRAWMAGGFPGLVAEVPELRDSLLRHRVFLDSRTRWLAPAGVLAWLLGSRRLAAVAATAWLATTMRRHPGARPEEMLQLVVRDAVLEVALVAGSIRARSLVL